MAVQGVEQPALGCRGIAAIMAEAQLHKCQACVCERGCHILLPKKNRKRGRKEKAFFFLNFGAFTHLLELFFSS